MFARTGIHREVKPTGVVRLGMLYTILTRERGFRLQGTVNCGEVTRKYVAELIKVYFVKLRLCRLILVLTLSLAIQGAFFILVQEGGDILFQLYKGKCTPCT